MNSCMQEIYEVHPAASSNRSMQLSDSYACLEDSPGSNSCGAVAVPSHSIYMEQAWALNQPYTCSYPGNMFKSKDSDLDMALNQYGQPEYFTEEKPTFPQGRSPSYSQRKGRDHIASICSKFQCVSPLRLKVAVCICFVRFLNLNTEYSKLKSAVREVAR